MSLLNNDRLRKVIAPLLVATGLQGCSATVDRETVQSHDQCVSVMEGLGTSELTAMKERARAATSKINKIRQLTETVALDGSTVVVLEHELEQIEDYRWQMIRLKREDGERFSDRDLAAMSTHYRKQAHEAFGDVSEEEDGSVTVIVAWPVTGQNNQVVQAD